IVWPVTFIPEKYLLFLKLNPVYYLVEGYRQSFLFKTPFWEIPHWQTAYFWGVSFFLLFAGIFIFHRLRPHFADVL
ncbi:MAG: ABC transporter permease, partial [Bacteroidota bacterium]|nr:ABC transporter permease [Bacteroidota bacterium]